MKKKIIALYCRTSTSHQVKGLESQERVLKKYCEHNDIKNYEIFSDFNFSGKLCSRPKFDEMMNLVRSEKVSTIVTPNLSRIARSLKLLLEFIEEVQYFNIEFISLSESLNINSMHGRLMVSVLGAVSQLEREMISEKTRIGLQNAREKGKVLGRERKLPYERIIALAEETELSVRAIAKIQGCSPSSVSRILQKHKAEKLKPLKV